MSAAEKTASGDNSVTSKLTSNSPITKNVRKGRMVPLASGTEIDNPVNDLTPFIDIKNDVPHCYKKKDPKKLDLNKLRILINANRIRAGLEPLPANFTLFLAKTVVDTDIAMVNGTEHVAVPNASRLLSLPANSF